LSKSKYAFLAIAVIALVGILVVLLHGPAAFAADGYISDSMCGRTHMMPGASDVDCTVACVNAGAKYVLVTQNQIYNLEGDLNSVKPYAGKQVHLAGKLSGMTVTISSINGPK
jgi:hypothetical protein